MATELPVTTESSRLSTFKVPVSCMQFWNFNTQLLGNEELKTGTKRNYEIFEPPVHLIF
jgi:hypothetical protein